MSYETEFQAALMRRLNAPGSGIRVWRQNAGRIVIAGQGGRRRAIHMAPEGAADLCGIVDGGLMLQIECKGTYGQLRDEQKRWHEVISRRGGIWICCAYDARLGLEESVVQAERLILGEIRERTRGHHAGCLYCGGHGYHGDEADDGISG